jgi:hypothetical protein
VIWKYFVVGQVMGDYDTDVAEYLYKPGAQRAGLSKLLCKDLSKACVGKVPPVPKVILATCELPYLSALLSVQCIFISQCTSHLSKFMLYLQLVPMLGLLGAIKFLYLDFTMNLVSVLLVQDREPGEAFTPKPTKDAEMERLMRSMSVCSGILYLVLAKDVLPRMRYIGNMKPFLHKGWLMSLFACRTCQEQVA